MLFTQSETVSEATGFSGGMFALALLVLFILDRGSAWSAGLSIVPRITPSGHSRIRLKTESVV
jgi:hypothetical protein